MLPVTPKVNNRSSQAIDSSYVEEKQSHKTHDKNNTTNDHTKNHPPHFSTCERLQIRL